MKQLKMSILNDPAAQPVSPLLGRQVVKRDGTIAPWDSSRINRAIALAYFHVAHGTSDNPHRADAEKLFGLDEETFERAQQLTGMVERAALHRFPSDKPISIDDVQDLVETCIAMVGDWDVAKSYVVYRTLKNEVRPRRHEVSGLQDFIAVSRYARYRPDLNRREVWAECAERVRNMHLRMFSPRAVALPRRTVLEALQKSGEVGPGFEAGFGKFTSLTDDIWAAFELVKERKILPSMRSVQFGGPAIEAAHARLYNCSFSFADRPAFFKEAFYLLLCGTGVGFSVQKHHVEKLPVFPIRGEEMELPVKHVSVEDTIEGWADAVGALFDSFFENSFAEFNFSKIRPRGAPLRTAGGRAPGHLPLKRGIDNVSKILRGASGRQLRPIEVYDIIMHLAQAVLSGGVRRSATICLFSPDDGEMANAKTGNWFETAPQRAFSNNSALLERKTATKEQFLHLFERQKEFGEPGFYFSADKDYGANPCVPADTWVMTAEGPRQAGELVGHAFDAIVRGESHASTAPGFFRTGVKPLRRVSTHEGHELRVTANHQLLVARDVRRVRRGAASPTTRRRELVTEWIPAGELRAGDRLVLHRHENLSWGGYGSQEEGWLVGLLLGDGNLLASQQTAHLDFWGEERLAMLASAVAAIGRTVGSHGRVKPRGYDQPAHARCRVGSRELFKLADRFGLTPEKKKLNETIERTSAAFHTGFLRGWFDADGSVQGAQAKGVSVRLTSVSHANLRVAQRMLLRLGINSTLYTDRNRHRPTSLLPDGRGGRKAYAVQPIHELVVAGANLATFAVRVGFSQPSKRNALESRLAHYRRRLNADDFTATVAALEDAGVEPVYDCTVPGPHAFDADGFYAHNCVEIGLHPRLVVAEEDIVQLRRLGLREEVQVGDRLTGWQMCNLSTINGAAPKDRTEFLQLCKYAALLGTLQAAYTDIPYLGPVTRWINQREALLGVSICGILDNPEMLLDPQTLEAGAEMVRGANALYADLLGIRRAARTTCVKPEGTASLLLGTGSGIHPHHAKRYFRRVQVNRIDPVYKYFKHANAHMTEKSAYNQATDDVVTFPVEAPEHAITRRELSATRFLDYVKLVQTHWVEAGRGYDTFSPGLHHNVSNTINVAEHEWDEVAEFVWNHRDHFTGIALLTDVGDKTYLQAPREEITTDEDVRKWNALVHQPVDYAQMRETTDATALRQELACAGGACELTVLSAAS